MGIDTVLDLPGRFAVHRRVIVTLLTQGVAGLKELGLRMIRWRVRWYWYALAVGIPLAVLGLIVGFLLGTMAVTFWYSWLFNHTGGSVLMTIIAHAAQGTITIGGLWSLGADFARANLLTGVVWSTVAIGLVVLDWKAWRGPAPDETKTLPQAAPSRGATSATPA